MMLRFLRRQNLVVLSPLAEVLFGAAVGVAITAVLWGLQAAFPGPPFLFWYPLCVGVVGYIGGRLAGITAALVSFVLVWFLFIPPAYSFVIAPGAAAFTVTFGLALFTMAVAGFRVRNGEMARIQDDRTRRHLAAIVKSSEDAIFSKTLDGVILTWNAGAERLYGYRPAEVIGRSVSILVPRDRPNEFPTIMARLRQGQFIDHFESVRVRKDGSLVDVSLAISPVRDESGRIMGAATIARNISERKRSIERTVRLQQMSAALSGALTAQVVAKVCVDQGLVAIGAKAGSLALVDEGEGWLELIQATGYPPEFADRWRETPIEKRVAAAVAIRTQQPQFLESREALLQLYRASIEPVPILPDAGARAVIPLRVGRDVIGVLSFLFPAAKVFAEDERAFILTIGQQCAEALERARLYEREHRVSVTLQRALLPTNLPQAPDVAIHAAYLPGASESDVGGDWYDVFRLPSGLIGISVGDVVGKGLNAAVIMGQVRQAIRAAAMEAQNPPTVLQQVGRVIEWTAGSNEMATALFGTLNPTDLTFTYASAGHPAPVIATIGNQACVLECRGGLPLGIHRMGPLPSNSVALPPGALLVLYTDGLTELNRNLAEGEATLLAASSTERDLSPADPAQAILKRVLVGRQPADDIAIVTLSVAATPLERLSLALPATPASVREVRHAFRRLAKDLGIATGVATIVEIALGEAVSNVVAHAYGAALGSVHVRVWREADLVIAEIEDHGQWRRERPEDRGYGLRIMRALSDSADVRCESSGTTVRLSISLAHAAQSAKCEEDVDKSHSSMLP
jgi:PAS domain S-box-containing protein